ncbi:MAG: cation:proton antiporter [Magnetococcales bacterium]|nr:cation:proton antiporter [Magnetococcales bacterium]
MQANSITNPAPLLLILGGIFLLGVLADLLGERIRIPRISFLLLIGLLMGPLGLDLISPSGQHQGFSVTADIALVIVGFLLGGHFTKEAVREHGQLVLLFSITIVVVSVLVVLFGLLLLGAPIEIALLLAGIATATDPAAIVDVIKETRAKGLFSKTLMGIVAIDDALGLIAFSVLLAVARSLGGGTGFEHVLHSLWEIGGALIVGGGVGLLMALTLSLIHAGECPSRKERVFMETLGFVLLCGGLAIYLKVSFLLSAMMLGVVVVNLMPATCVSIFQAIEDIAWPFLILFFVFAGASLQPESLPQIGLIGLGYVALRVLGRILGGWIGGRAARAEPPMRQWMGVALMPQAGIALGMALVAIQQFPHLKDTLLPIVVGSTVLFQLVGPILTRLALLRTGDAARRGLGEKEERL